MTENRPWLHRLAVGGSWAAGAAIGWWAGVTLMAASIMASGMWDPDEVEIYLNTPPWQSIVNGLLMGAILGAILGVGVGLIWWLARRNVKDALLSILATTALGSLLCAVAGTSGPSQYQSAIAIALRGGILGGGVAGGISGLIQSIILQGRVTRASRWIWATIAGYVIGWGIMFGFAGPFTLDDPSGTRLPLVPIPLMCGALVGLGQWLILQRSVKQAGWWIPLNAAAWEIAYLPFYFGIWGGIAVGLVTGATMAWLLPPPDGDAPSR